ncbi:hypothetical protein, partial [Klebsiella pneumoniae]
SMRSFMVLLFPLISVTIAGVLAFRGIDGWGWFLLAAVLCAGADTVQKHVSTNKKEPAGE